MGDQHTPCCSIEQDLKDLSHWAAATGVQFNALKSAELCLGTHLPPRPLVLDGSAAEVPRVSAQVHLGVHLDKKPRWSGHIERLKSVAGPVALCKRLIYRHHLLRRLFVNSILHLSDHGWSTAVLFGLGRPPISCVSWNGSNCGWPAPWLLVNTFVGPDCWSC